MNTNLTILPSSLIIRATVEYLASIITIILNTIFIISIIRLKTLHTPQNVLLINSALNLICSCLTFLLSVAIAISYSKTNHINMYLCRITGYLIYSFCHGTMYSYLLLSINRVLHIFYRINRHHSTNKCISIQIGIQWICAFLVPSIALFLNRIEFQRKPRFCSACKPFYMTLGIFTGFFMPIICITIFNLIIYYRINKVNTNIHSIYRQKRILTFNQIRKNKKSFKLLRQFAAFSLVIIIGWGFFAFISIFDTNEILPESIYLITLSFPSVSLLIITSMIINWNKSIRKSMHKLFHMNSETEYSISATTVHFTRPHSLNYLD